MHSKTWARWQDAAGPWRGWSVCLTLLAPEATDVVPREEPQPAAHGIATQLATQMAQGGVCVALDLDPVLGVHIAGRLNQMALAHVVLVLPRWPYVRGVLAVDGLLYALLHEARNLTRHEHATNVVFVLDAERSSDVPHRAYNDARADNRYRLSVADLPNLATLSARGIRRIVKLSSI